MSEQTTTAEIREMYAAEAHRYGFDGEEAFDAWLAAHDAEVAARAWDEGYSVAVSDVDPADSGETACTSNPYRIERQENDR